MRYNLAAVWGILMGCLTLAAGWLSMTSANPTIATIQIAFSGLLIPGLLVAAMVGSLIPGALLNAAIHFGLARLILQFLIRPNRSAGAS